MNEKCMLGCDFNYENISKKTTTNGFVCTPKTCGDRMPWGNGSCSAKEDFGGSEVVECFFSRVGNNRVETCVEKNECPEGYPGVCFRVLIFFIFYFLLLICDCIMFFLRCTMMEVGKEI
jgi:hypothetical protein